MSRWGQCRSSPRAHSGSILWRVWLGGERAHDHWQCAAGCGRNNWSRHGQSDNDIKTVFQAHRNVTIQREVENGLEARVMFYKVGDISLKYNTKNMQNYSPWSVTGRKRFRPCDAEADFASDRRAVTFQH